jgi:RNA polymerase sigma-70 factor, ECF subfamily
VAGYALGLRSDLCEPKKEKRMTDPKSRQPVAPGSANLVQPEPTQLIRRYAAEMRAFLRSRTASRHSMEDVYAVFTEDVWKGLPQLRSEKHMRSWLYVVARNALSRHIRFKQRWRQRHTFSGLETLPAEARQSYGTRQGNLAQLAPLLAELNEPDRQLLDQRLIKALPWREIAMQSARAAGDASEESVTRESARLRKRYQLLLLSLRQRADLNLEA